MRTSVAQFIVVCLSLGVTMVGSSSASGADKSKLPLREKPRDAGENVKAPPGSGLIYKLPEDGATATFDFDRSVKGTGRRVISTNELTLRSAGQENVDGEPCRWIEFQIAPETRQSNSLRPHTANLLIPEKYLKSGDNPLGHVVKGTINDNGKVRDIKGALKPEDSPVYALLPAKLDEVSTAETVPLPGPLGEVRCEGIIGIYKFKSGEDDVKATYDIYFHDRAPFGVYGMEVEIEISRKGRVVSHEINQFDLTEIQGQRAVRATGGETNEK